VLQATTTATTIEAPQTNTSRRRQRTRSCTYSTYSSSELKKCIILHTTPNECRFPPTHHRWRQDNLRPPRPVCPRPLLAATRSWSTSLLAGESSAEHAHHARTWFRTYVSLLKTSATWCPLPRNQRVRRLEGKRTTPETRARGMNPQLNHATSKLNTNKQDKQLRRPLERKSAGLSSCPQTEILSVQCIRWGATMWRSRRKIDV